MRSASHLVVLFAVCLGCASSDAKGHAPKAAPDPKCAKAYSPPICMAGQPRCETDANGCEICTCDETPLPPPGPAGN
jgi:hypothetical protein